MIERGVRPILNYSLGASICSEDVVHDKYSRLQSWALLGLLILPLRPIPSTTVDSVVALKMDSIWSTFMLREYGCFVTRKMADPVIKIYAPKSK